MKKEEIERKETWHEITGPVDGMEWLTWVKKVINEEKSKHKNFNELKEDLLKKHNIKISDNEDFKKIYNVK